MSSPRIEIPELTYRGLARRDEVRPRRVDAAQVEDGLGIGAERPETVRRSTQCSSWRRPQRCYRVQEQGYVYSRHPGRTLFHY